ncbi:putative signal transduction protein with Nacht domain [Calothrix sp. NIES-4071]|nr:putative signal transduction protein with Nacht domain [Calothrix sp. NIES-4071]BAZ59617.1 putative signal transduction protein with Nacht domain [Calothrix sp. NIES-4105]
MLNKTQISENEGFFSAITKNIRERGFTNQRSTDVLIYIMQSSPSKDDCYTAIYLLEDIALASDVQGRNKVTTALIAFLQKNRGDIICLSAAYTLLSIDPGNQTAINLLVEVLELNRSEWVCQDATSILLQVGYYHPKVLENLIDSVSLQKSFKLHDMYPVSRYLPLIKDNRNYTNVLDIMITHCLELFQNTLAPEYEEESISPYQDLSYSYKLVELSDQLLRTLQPRHLSQVVTSLKTHLNQFSYNSTSYRYEAVYNLIWYCAQNMTYPDFCKAWQHQDPLACL